MQIEEIMGRLDSLYQQGDLPQADRELQAWIAAARKNDNKAVLLSLYNEQAGLFRVTGRAAEAKAVSEQVLRGEASS